MTRRQRLLFSSAAAAVIAGGLASKAMAFDVVDWKWEKYVDVTETINITVNDTFDLSGLVELEKWQLNFGDVTATATASGIYNNTPGVGGDGTVLVPIDGSGTFDLSYVDPADDSGTQGSPGEVLPTVVQDASGLDLTISGGTADENTNTLSGIGYEFGGQVEVQVGDLTLPGENDAVDLPEVLNTATAVANNQSITTTTALQLDDLQIAAGDINSINQENGNPDARAFLIGALGVTQVDNQLGGINQNYDMAALAIIGAATGFIEPTDISATATVSDILNASVDNSATAVGNNASYKINAATPGDGYIVADLTQLVIGDVTALASATDISVNNYNNFGGAGFGNLSDPQTPLVSNVATAVGNNLNINVDNCNTCDNIVVGPNG